MGNKLFLPLFLGFILTLSVLLFVFYNRPVPNTPVTPSVSLPVSQNQQAETMEKVEEQVIPGMPEVPVYPGAIIEESFKRTNADGNEYFAEWTAGATLVEILEFYRTALPESGWTIVEIPAPGEPIFEESTVATKGNLRLTIMLEYETEQDPTEIIVHILEM